MGSAADAAALLLTDDPAEAAELADRLEANNLDRRVMTRKAVLEANAAVASEPGDGAATVVLGPWPIGVIGLVAARLVDERGRPAVVGTELDGVIRASCRSAGGVDLAAILTACDDLLTRHGGHPGAAGFELRRRAGTSSATRFIELAGAGLGDGAIAQPALQVELILPALGLDYALIADLARLAPTGPGNPEPLIVVAGLTVTRVRAAAGGHTQLTLKRRLDVIDGIAFGWPELAELVHEGDRIDVVARLGDPLIRRLRIAPARDPRRRSGWVQPGRRRAPGRWVRRRGSGVAGRPDQRRDGVLMAEPGSSPARTGRSSDPYGLMPRSSIVAPFLAGVALLLVAALTAALFVGWIPVSLASKSTSGGGGGGSTVQVNATPAPSNVVVTDPRADIPGSLVYVKAGNVWIQTAGKATQLTTKVAPRRPRGRRTASGSTTSRRRPGRRNLSGGNGGPARYTMNVPTLTRISPDGQTIQPLLGG